MPSKKGLKYKFFDRFLLFVEKTANYLPDPFFIFSGLAILTIILSWLFASLNTSVIHPGTGEEVFVFNLLSKTGIQRMFTDAVTNFTGFPPLGLVLVTVIGIGVAEKSGMFEALLKRMIGVFPGSFVVPAIIFASVNSSLMADSGVVVLPPLAALIFKSIGRNPIAGICASFGAVCAGFSANLFITALDPLLSGFTEPAARIVDSSYEVYPTANYYFMIPSVFIITIICTWVTNKIVEPRLAQYESDEKDTLEEISTESIRGLRYSGIAFIIINILLLLSVIPENGIFRGEGGTLIPFYRSIVPLIMVIFFICGTVYGIASGTVRNNHDLAGMASDAMKTMGAYIILAFAAGQFVAYFDWSNIGLVLAVNGANAFKAAGLEGPMLLIVFFIFSSIMNIFVSSASAKWAVFAPVFVPMLMLTGISPEATQLAYRVGDSITNIITPLLPYFPIVIVFAKHYDKEMSFGRLVGSLLPYSFFLFLVWGAFLALWIIFDIPPGPEASIFLK